MMVTAPTTVDASNANNPSIPANPAGALHHGLFGETRCGFIQSSGAPASASAHVRSSRRCSRDVSVSASSLVPCHATAHIIRTASRLRTVPLLAIHLRQPLTEVQPVRQVSHQPTKARPCRSGVTSAEILLRQRQGPSSCHGARRATTAASVTTAAPAGEVDLIARAAPLTVTKARRSQRIPSTSRPMISAVRGCGRPPRRTVLLSSQRSARCSSFSTMRSRS